MNEDHEYRYPTLSPPSFPNGAANGGGDATGFSPQRRFEGHAEEGQDENHLPMLEEDPMIDVGGVQLRIVKEEDESIEVDIMDVNDYERPNEDCRVNDQVHGAGLIQAIQLAVRPVQPATRPAQPVYQFQAATPNNLVCQIVNPAGRIAASPVSPPVGQPAVTPIQFQPVGQGAVHVPSLGLPVSVGPPDNVSDDVSDFDDEDPEQYIQHLHNQTQKAKKKVEEKTKKIEELLQDKQRKIEKIQKLREDKQAQAKELEKIRRIAAAKTKKIKELRRTEQEQVEIIKELRQKKQVQATVMEEKDKEIQDLRCQKEASDKVLESISTRLTQLIADEPASNRPATKEPPSDNQDGISLPNLRNMDEFAQFLASQLDTIDALYKKKTVVLNKLLGGLQKFNESRKDLLPNPPVSNFSTASTNTATGKDTQSSVRVADTPRTPSIVIALPRANPGLCSDNHGAQQRMSSGSLNSQGTVGKKKSSSNSAELPAHHSKESQSKEKVISQNQQLHGKGFKKSQSVRKPKAGPSLNQSQAGTSLNQPQAGPSHRQPQAEAPNSYPPENQVQNDDDECMIVQADGQPRPTFTAPVIIFNRIKTEPGKPYRKKRHARDVAADRRCSDGFTTSPYKCVCGIYFADRTRLTKHLQAWKNFKPETIDNVTVIRGRHNAPDRRQAIREKKFFCPLCDDRFPTYQRLKAHQERRHGITSDPNNIGCVYCGQKFRTRKAYWRHQMTSHTGEYALVRSAKVRKPEQPPPPAPVRHGQNRSQSVLLGYFCHCTKKFGTFEQLNCHLKEEFQDFKCSLCPDKKFLGLKAFQWHMTKTHGKTQTTA